MQHPRPEGPGPQCFPAERVWALLASSVHSPGRTHVALTRHLLAAGLGAGLSEASVSPPVWQWPSPSSLLHPYPFLLLHAAPGWAHCAPCWSHAPPEEGGEGWERGLGTGRRVPGVVFGCGFRREGEGLRDCCFYNNLTNWRAEARWGLPDRSPPGPPAGAAHTEPLSHRPGPVAVREDQQAAGLARQGIHQRGQVFPAGTLSPEPGAPGSRQSYR